MKNKIFYISLLVIAIIILIGYYTNWFGISKPSNNTSRLINTQTSIVSCPNNCTLSTNTSGASGTATNNNTTYTCRCSDGSTTTPIVS